MLYGYRVEIQSQASDAAEHFGVIRAGKKKYCRNQDIASYTYLATAKR